MITGAMLLADTPDVRADLEFPNPFDDAIFCAYIATPNGLLVPRAYCEKEVFELDVVDRNADIKLSEGYKLRDYQEPPISGILEYFSSRTYGQCLLQADTGSGKALRNSELVLTPHGFVQNGSIKVGDYVIGSSGTPIAVTGVFPQYGKRKIYRVTFRDNTTVDCDADHLWTVHKRAMPKDKYTTIQTSSMLTTGLYKERFDKRYATVQKEYLYSTPRVSPIDTCSNYKLPIDPYLLGLLIGDGCFRHKHGISFTTKNRDILNSLPSRLPEDVKIGYCVHKNGAYHLKIIKKDTYSANRNSLDMALQELGLFGHLSTSKFIPDIYKLASLPDRMAIIQGLIDTDGYVVNGKLEEYSTSSERLANDFLEVGRSIGMFLIVKKRASGYRNKGGEYVECSTSYRINSLHYARKSIVSIDYICDDYATCISVDAEDSLYVVNGYNLTHNSFSLSAVLASISRTTLILSHLTMLGDQIKNEMISNLEADIDVITAKSLGNPLPSIGVCSFKLLENEELLEYLANFYSFVIVDEMENCMTTTRLKVLFTLRPRHQLYLTATPSKELVQQTKAVQYMYDKVFLMEQPEETKVHSKHLMVDFSHLRWESPQNPMMYKTSLGRFFTHSEILPWLVKLCYDLKTQGLLGTIWIVADLNKLQDQLEKRLIKQGLTVGIIRGDTRKKQRDLILGQIANRELDVLVGSAPLSAGVSIPELSMGIRVMPNSSSEELLEQQKGRLGRRCDFKSWQIPAWIDFRITGSLEYSAKKRFQVYKETTFGVKMVKPTEVLKEIL